MRRIAFALSLVFIFLIPWEGMVRLPWGTVAKVLGLAVGGFWMTAIIFTGRLRKIHGFHFMVCLFVLWNALSVFWSENPNRALTKLSKWTQILELVIILWELYTTRA